jgi:hypothetical protein
MAPMTLIIGLFSQRYEQSIDQYSSNKLNRLYDRIIV